MPKKLTPPSQSTKVEYVGEATEAYTVTVPSSMKPGETKQVTATGQWQSNHQLVVTADESVTLANSLSDDEKTLDITFDGIYCNGDNEYPITDVSEDVTVAEITGVLFGEWTGHFDYTVAINETIDIASIFTLSPQTVNFSTEQTTVIVTATLSDIRYLDILSVEEYAGFFPGDLNLEKCDYLSESEKNTIGAIDETKRLEYLPKALKKLKISEQFVCDTIYDDYDYKDYLKIEVLNCYAHEATTTSAPTLSCRVQVTGLQATEDDVASTIAYFRITLKALDASIYGIVNFSEGVTDEDNNANIIVPDGNAEDKTENTEKNEDGEQEEIPPSDD